MKSNEHDKLNGNETSIAEPPKIIRHLAWILDKRNSKIYWKYLLAAVIVICSSYAIKVVLTKPELHTPSNKKAISPRDLLSESEVRFAIQKALQDGNATKAISILVGLSDSPLKKQECEHVFNYCMKNERLDDSVTLVNSCWEGKVRLEKLSRIEHEKLKQ